MPGLLDFLGLQDSLGSKGLLGNLQASYGGPSQMQALLLGLGGSDQAMTSYLAGQRAQQYAASLPFILGPGGLGGNVPTPTIPAGGGPLPAPPYVPRSGTGAVSPPNKIYSQNEPNPLDPPAPAERDAAIRTIFGEAANQGPLGQLAVANVIRNRAANGIGGDNAGSVVTAPNQFEPWNTADGRSRMASLSPNDPRYQQIGRLVDATYSGAVDPTNGATHFYAPKAQAALGRQAPAWDNGAGQDIGDHRFFGGAGGPSPAMAFAPGGPSAPAQPQPQQQGFNLTTPQLQAMAQTPEGAAMVQKLIEASLVQQLSPKFDFQTLPDGTVLRVNKSAGTASPAYQSNKPQFAVIGKDANGNDVHGFIDPVTRQVTPVNAAGQVGAGSITTPNDLTGEAFLQTLDKGRAAQIKAIVEGRMSPPGAYALRSPQMQALLRDAAQYEPGFDLTTWGARDKTRKDFASGKMGQNISSFNTAIAHLNTLQEAADKLDNTRFPWVNTVKNMVASNTGDERVNAFQVAKTAVADELTRAFRGTGGNVHDLVQWENAINSAASPQQLKAAIKQAVELLRGRIEAVGDQYNRGMGKTTDPLNLLAPKAAEVLRKLSGEAPAGKSSGAADPLGIR